MLPRFWWNQDRTASNTTDDPLPVVENNQSPLLSELITEQRKLRRSTIDFVTGGTHSSSSIIDSQDSLLEEEDYNLLPEEKLKLPAPKAKPKSRLPKCCSRIWKRVTVFFFEFFVDAFYIPAYRPEWGRYKRWRYYLPPKPELTPHQLRERAALRRRMQLLRYIKRVGGPGVIHNSADCALVTINVSGYRYQTQIRTLKQFPATLLGNSARRQRYLDPERNEYFLDRHRSSFEAILYYYQSGGILSRLTFFPSGIPFKIFENELKFYDLGAEVFNLFLQNEGIVKEDEKRLPKSLFLRKIWLLVEYPESSKQAHIFSSLSVFIVLYSIVLFCLETLPEFNQPKDLEAIRKNPEKDIFFISESICIFWFSFEFLLRLLSSPSKYLFFKNFLNVVDLIAIIPFFVHIAIRQDESVSPQRKKVKTSMSTLVVFRVIRLVRVFRIFKLTRHSRGLQILGKTLRASLRELGLLVFFLVIGIVLFSSAMYFAEYSESVRIFPSIPHTFWWGIITMTTIGYGDMVPVGVYGRIVGGLCAIAGLLTVALPVPVIVSNFNYFYNRETDVFQEGDVRLSCQHVDDCPFRPTCGSVATSSQLMNRADLLNENKEGDLSETKEISSLESSEQYISSSRRIPSDVDRSPAGIRYVPVPATNNPSLAYGIRTDVHFNRSQPTPSPATSKK